MGVVILIVVTVLVVAAVVWLIGLYNGLVRLRNRIENAWAQVDVQLRYRYDLIPNLVETVKGYAGHERETFEAVTAARSAGVSAQGVAEQAQAENLITSALRQLLAVSEAYPDLKADARFAELQDDLQTTEERIAFARQFYNDTVLRLNTRIETFPAVLVARVLGFEAAEYFRLDGEAEARGPVEVEF